MVAEVNEEGEAMLTVEHPDRGPGVVISQFVVDICKEGNVAASLSTSPTD